MTLQPAAAMPFPTRQGASAFDQSLNLDTSSVTTMKQMFFVRSALHADIAVL
jgi:hypothetical protein